MAGLPLALPLGAATLLALMYSSEESMCKAEVSLLPPQVARLPEALPQGAAGPRPQPSFYGLSQLPVRHSMYSSTLSQLSMLGASYGPLDPSGVHLHQTSGQIQVDLFVNLSLQQQGPLRGLLTWHMMEAHTSTNVC